MSLFVLDLYSGDCGELRRQSLSLYLLEGLESLIKSFSHNVMMCLNNKSVRFHGRTGTVAVVISRICTYTFTRQVRSCRTGHQELANSTYLLWPLDRRDPPAHREARTLGSVISRKKEVARRRGHRVKSSVVDSRLREQTVCSRNCRKT